MAIFEVGNMWDIWDETDYFVFTGNAIIKNNGALVMGRGIAREVRDRFPNIDLAIGRRMKEYADPYGFLFGKKVCVFQVKHHWQDDADIGLIKHATDCMLNIANDLPDKRFDMNFAGIGNGRRADAYEEIKSILSVLPDNVHIWTFR